MTIGKTKSLFTRFARWTSKKAGQPIAFGLAVGVLILWGISGPIFHFSDTWQLVINTGTTIVTFLMVFLIQNTQNRDSTALHLKLDELIYSSKAAKNSVLDLEELEEKNLDAIRDEYEKAAKTERTKPEKSVLAIKPRTQAKPPAKKSKA